MDRLFLAREKEKKEIKERSEPKLEMYLFTSSTHRAGPGDFEKLVKDIAVSFTSLPSLSSPSQSIYFSFSMFSPVS
jgi:hypothetical protein